MDDHAGGEPYPSRRVYAVLRRLYRLLFITSLVGFAVTALSMAYARSLVAQEIASLQTMGRLIGGGCVGSFVIFAVSAAARGACLLWRCPKCGILMHCDPVKMRSYSLTSQCRHCGLPVWPRRT